MKSLNNYTPEQKKGISYKWLNNPLKNYHQRQAEDKKAEDRNTILEMWENYLKFSQLGF